MAFHGSARLCTKGAKASARWTRTVYRSATSTASTAPRRLAKGDLLSARSSEYFTSAATTSRPCTGGLDSQRTPGRSLMV